MRKRPVILLSLILSVFILVACTSSGGDGDGDDDCADPTVNASGDWWIEEYHVDHNCDEASTDSYTLEITQSGSSISIYSPDLNQTFNGRICGDVITASGSYPEDGGTTTITALTVTIEGDDCEGDSDWRWTDGTTCSGTTYFTGYKY